MMHDLRYIVGIGGGGTLYRKIKLRMDQRQLLKSIEQRDSRKWNGWNRGYHAMFNNK